MGRQERYDEPRNDVFDFIRLEDIASDKRPGMSNVVYIADTGARHRRRGATRSTTSTNGRIWKLELDKSDPTKARLSILVQGDDNPVKTPGEIHQPDNLETTANGSLLVTEDPGSSQQFALPHLGPERDDGADLAGAARRRVARDRGQGGPASRGRPDRRRSAARQLGRWESSGVVDASAVFGPGAFLVDVQAHTLWIEKARPARTP